MRASDSTLYELIGTHLSHTLAAIFGVTVDGSLGVSVDEYVRALNASGLFGQGKCGTVSAMRTALSDSSLTYTGRIQFRANKCLENYAWVSFGGLPGGIAADSATDDSVLAITKEAMHD